MSWELIQETQLDGAVRSVTVMTGGTELIVCCNSSTIYRMLITDLSTVVVGVGHAHDITCISFATNKNSLATGPGEGSQAGTLFATGTSSGEIKVWDVADYACLAGKSNIVYGFISISISLYLYTCGILCNVEWCIRQL